MATSAGGSSIAPSDAAQPHFRLFLRRRCCGRLMSVQYTAVRQLIPRRRTDFCRPVRLRHFTKLPRVGCHSHGAGFTPNRGRTCSPLQERTEQFTKRSRPAREGAGRDRRHGRAGNAHTLTLRAALSPSQRHWLRQAHTRRRRCYLRSLE